MIAFFKSLFGLLEAFGRFIADRQLIEAGKAQQRDADQRELKARVEQAEAAACNPDPDRLERMRSRFDRSRNGE